MPATFTCAQVHQNNGIRQIAFSRMKPQPNYVYLNITADVLANIFDAEVREGDVWTFKATLVSRAGSNGSTPSPLSEKV